MEYPISRIQLQNIRDKFMNQKLNTYFTMIVDNICEQIFMEAMMNTTTQVVILMDYLPSLSFKNIPSVKASKYTDDIVVRLLERFPDTSISASSDKNTITVNWS